MAKYAQGYGRKNSDTKNLIILFSSIVALIVVAVVIAVIVGKVRKPAKTLNDYTDYQITNYSKVLDQSEGDYIVYVYSSNDTADTNAKAVMQYIDDYEAKKCVLKLYLIDAHLFTQQDYTSSDSYYATAGTNETAIKEELENLGSVPTSGMLFSVIGGDLTNKATQTVTATKSEDGHLSVADTLKALKKNETALGLNETK